MNGMFLRQEPAHAAAKLLIALVLSFLALPSLVPAQTLLHRYSFVSNADDSVGTANGTLVAPSSSGSPATINNGLTLPGGGGGGYSGYVSLPNGILTDTTNLTIECWATQDNANGWATIWDFANDGGHNFEMCPYPLRGINNLDVAITPNGGEVDTITGSPFPSGSEQYVTFTFNAAALTGRIYVNGVLAATQPYPNATYIPGSIGGSGGTSQNWLGNDTFGDTQFQGTIHELRIWNGVVPQRQIAASAVLGPGTLVTNLNPTSVSVAAGPSVIITGTEQASVTVQLPQTGSSDLPATTDATNWTSSDPGVLSVDGSGVVTGVGVGSATVSATVAGVTATSGSIAVTGPPTLLHRYSFVSDASDSVGGAQWDGTVVAPGDTNGSPATINNGLTLPGGDRPGYSGYVTLPGGILTNTTSLTIECWVTQNNGNTWAQIWNFGNSQSRNMGLIPLPGRDNGNLEAGINPYSVERDVVSSIHFPTNSEQYVSLVFNSSTLKSALYDNGTLLATQTYPNRAYIPGSIGGATGTTNNVLGQDPYPDPQFQGTIRELRIWNGALSPVYEAVAAAAGPGVVVTNLTPTSLTVTVTNTSMIGAQTQQATVAGDFVDASGVNVTSGATNWTSSDPTVLTVDGSGLITAQSGGSATISATVNGVTATSATINVADTAPTITQAPATNQTVAVGDTVNLAVAALGGGLRYQWSFGAAPIAGATNTTLALTNISLANAGTYSVSVTNSIGNTNVSVTLTVVQAILEHRYSFVSDASDSVGGPQWDGTLVNPGNTNGSPATINNGLTLPGGGGNDYSGYLALPKGILTNTTSLTVECWVSQDVANGWATVWDFANDGSHNFEMAPYPLRNINNLFVAITPHGNEIDTITHSPFPSGSEEYAAFTFNAGTLTGRIYTNGVQDAMQAYPDATYIPGTIGGASGTSQNWLGNDTYGDAQFQGTIYEFRIWDGVVSPLYLAVSAAAGPGVVVTNLTPTSVTVMVTNTTMIVGQTQPATVTGDFVDASGITVTSDATNWTSSDPSVLTVDGSGMITPVGPGNATVNGVTGTSPTVTVPTSGPVLTQEPETNETLLVGATLRTSVANNGNPPFVYRWYYNAGATPISIATNNPTLMVPNIQLSDAGSYTCVVSNQYGTATSSALTLAVVTPTPYQQALLSYGPIACWPLDETNGSTIAYDVIGGHNGTYNGYVVFGNPGPTNSFFGASSYSAQFDGYDSYVDVPGGPLNITNAITTVAWVNLLTAPTFGGIMGHGDASWRMSINGSGQPGANDGTSASGDATDPIGSPGILDGNWHMIAYTYTGVPGQANNGSLYVDGALVANNTVTAVPAGDDLDVWIGGSPDYGTARLLNANIAGAAVFDQALTTEQVQGLYNGTFVAGPQTISITHSGANVILKWETGTLLEAPTVLGPWTTNNAAASPYSVPATNANQFFRLLVSP